MNKGRALSAVSCAADGGVRLAALPAAAEDAPAGGDAIVVTGTLIGAAREDAPAPVDVITTDELAAQGNSVDARADQAVAGLGRACSAMPASSTPAASSPKAPRRSTCAGSARSARWCCSTASDSAAIALGNVPLVDVNLIPMAAMGRIEILKDGAATTYGLGRDRRGGQLHHPHRPGRVPRVGDYR